jgi:hypothetical protein
VAQSSTPAGGVTRQSWAAALLADLGAPVDATNIGTIVGWEIAEGGAGPQFNVPNNITSYNPLNVSLTSGPKGYGYDPGTGVYYPGSTPTPGNSPPIAAFASWQQGLQATAARLEQPFAHGILADLKASDPTSQVAGAVVASKWGTPQFGPGPTTPGGTVPPTTAPAAGSSTGTSSTSSTPATLTGAFGIPGLPSWLDPATDVGSLVSGLESAGLVLLGLVIVIVGLVLLAGGGGGGGENDAQGPPGAPRGARRGLVPRARGFAEHAAPDAAEAAPEAAEAAAV